VLYIAWDPGRFPLSVYFIMTAPLFLIAGLFLANWVLRAKIRPGT
jgi:hypothetical protein